MDITKKISAVLAWTENRFKRPKPSLLARNIAWISQDNNWLARITSNGNLERFLWIKRG